MIDYFALLEQPRRPQVDLDKLKAKYHELARAAHPDQARAEGDSAALNEAYRVLRDPKLRLRHLLELEGLQLETGSVPQDLSDVFLETGTLMQDVDRLLARSTSTALSKALLRSELAERQASIAAMLNKLQALQNKALAELDALDRRWTSPHQGGRELSGLASRFAYLARWIDQLEERKLRLSN